ncbi:MAG: EamA family transporter [Candidatus Binatia bacterium]
MSDTLIATLGGLWAMLLWGAGDWLLSRSSKKRDAFEANLSFQLPSVFISVLLVITSLHHVSSWHNIWVLVIASVIFAVAFLAFIRALATGAVGIIVPVANSYPFFTLVLTAIFLSLAFGHIQIIGMVTVVVGVLLLAYDKRDKKISLQVQHQAILLALTAAALWSVGNVVQNSVIGKEAWQNVLLAIDLPITLVALVMLTVKDIKNPYPGVKRALTDRASILSGTTYCAGSIGFYYCSVRVGSVIIPVIIGSVATLVTSALSAFFDGERLNVWKRVGAVVAVVGIVLINIQ